MTEQEVFVLATAPSIPDMLAGKTMEEAGRDNFKGDLLGATPKHAFAAVVDRACKAVWDIQDLDSTVHTSFGDFPHATTSFRSRTSGACGRTTSPK